MSAKTLPSLSQALQADNNRVQKATLLHLTAFNDGKAPNWNNLEKLFLIGFVKYLKDKVSPNTARTYCATLKGILNEYKDAVKIPCGSREYSKILSLKPIGVKNIYLTDEEIQKLIDYVPNNEHERDNIREHTVRNQFVISCLTGMRYSDTIRTELDNVDEGVISFLSKKTNTLNNAYTCEVIDTLLKENMNNIYSDKTFNYTIRKICKNVGIIQKVMTIKAGKQIKGEKYLFVGSHTGRRSFATNLYKATRDLFLVSKLMNHSDTTITERYICIDLHDNEHVKDYFNKFTVV